MVGSNLPKGIEMLASIVLLISIDLGDQTADDDSCYDFPPPPTWTLEEVPNKTILQPT